MKSKPKQNTKYIPIEALLLRIFIRFGYKRMPHPYSIHSFHIIRIPCLFTSTQKKSKPTDDKFQLLHLSLRRREMRKIHKFILHLDNFYSFCGMNDLQNCSNYPMSTTCSEMLCCDIILCPPKILPLKNFVLFYHRTLSTPTSYLSNKCEICTSFFVYG